MVIFRILCKTRAWESCSSNPFLNILIVSYNTQSISQFCFPALFDNCQVSLNLLRKLVENFHNSIIEVNMDILYFMLESSHQINSTNTSLPWFHEITVLYFDFFSTRFCLVTCNENFALERNFLEQCQMRVWELFSSIPYLNTLEGSYDTQFCCSVWFFYPRLKFSKCPLMDLQSKLKITINW